MIRHPPKIRLHRHQIPKTMGESSQVEDSAPSEGSHASENKNASEDTLDGEENPKDQSQKRTWP